MGLLSQKSLVGFQHSLHPTFEIHIAQPQKHNKNWFQTTTSVPIPHPAPDSPSSPALTWIVNARISPPRE